MLCIKYFTWIEVEPILSPKVPSMCLSGRAESLILLSPTSGLSEILATSAVSILAASLA